MTERDIQNQIRVAVSEKCIIFRTNAGEFWQGKRVYSKEFKQTVLINLRKVDGLPQGYSDLSGVRISDGKAVFIEVKTNTGKVSTKQMNFINQMRNLSAIAGICRSAEDAIQLIMEE